MTLFIGDGKPDKRLFCGSSLSSSVMGNQVKRLFLRFTILFIGDGKPGKRLFSVLALCSSVMGNLASYTFTTGATAAFSSSSLSSLSCVGSVTVLAPNAMSIHHYCYMCARGDLSLPANRSLDLQPRKLSRYRILRPFSETPQESKTLLA